MQAVLDDFLVGYNQRRSQQGRNMTGRKRAKAFVDGLPETTNRTEDDMQPEKPIDTAPLKAELSADPSYM